jgi:hypothetical protein
VIIFAAINSHLQGCKKNEKCRTAKNAFEKYVGVYSRKDYIFPVFFTLKVNNLSVLCDYLMQPVMTAGVP